jgi:antitoxin component YwqK of YwqJK toxin-antitoxin module
VYPAPFKIGLLMMRIHTNLMTSLLIYGLSFSNEMSVGFFNLKGNGLSDDKRIELSDRLLVELHKTKAFKIITTKELWDLLQKENVQKASKIEDFDINERSLNTIEESNLIKYLQHTSMLLNIETIILGTFSTADSNLYISIKLIKARDGQVITMANKECNLSNRDSLNRALMVVANEIAEPTGVLVYKEQVEHIYQGKGGNIITSGYGRRNKVGIFNFDKSEGGEWTSASEGINLFPTPLGVNNCSKYKIECINKDKRNELIYECYNNKNNLLEIANIKDTSWVLIDNQMAPYADKGNDYLFDGQMELYFPNGAISLKGLYKNGYLSNAVWFNECGDTIASYLSDIRKYKKMTMYYTDTIYAQSKISFGRLIYNNYSEEEGNDSILTLRKSYCENNSEYEYKCFCDVIVKINAPIDYNYQVYRNLLKHGLYTSFYPSGIIKDSALFVYGKIKGKLVKRYNNGKLEEISNWKNGIEDGEHIEYWENGNIRNKHYVNNGIFNGENIHYWENGKLASIVKIKNGVIEKPYYEYYEDGSKIHYVSVFNGILIGMDTSFGDKGNSISGLTYWENNEVIRNYNIFINHDFTCCELLKFEYHNSSHDTSSVRFRIDFKNGKNKYFTQWKNKDEIQIEDISTYQDDFQILLGSIDYKKRHQKELRVK